MSSHRRIFKANLKLAETLSMHSPVGHARKMRKDKQKARKIRKIVNTRASDATKDGERNALQAQTDATLNQGQRTTTRGQSARLGGEPITSRRRLT